MNTLNIFPTRTCYLNPGDQFHMLHYLRDPEEATAVSAPRYDPIEQTWDIDVVYSNGVQETICQSETYDRPWLVTRTPPVVSWVKMQEHQPRVGQTIKIVVNNQPEVIVWSGTETDVDIWRMMTDAEISEYNIAEAQKMFY